MVLNGLIGKKIGMTQIFDKDGNIIPATALKVGPCAVVQMKKEKNDGYDAVQLAFIEEKPPRYSNKPTQGHYSKSKIPPQKMLREFKILEGKVKRGDKFTVEIFKEVKKVDIVGTTKGKGFQGVIKRFGYKGGPASHGSKFHRASGSVGASAFPGRVPKGKKMPGHMGNNRMTAIGLKVIKIIPDKGVMLVKGSVPGPNGGYLLVKKSKRSGK